MHRLLNLHTLSTHKDTQHIISEMKLGISSLGHIIEYGTVFNEKYNSLIDLLLDASKACLEYAEENKLPVCELIVDPPDIFTSDKRKKFVEICNTFSIPIQIHGPFIDMNMCSHNDKISMASVESYIATAEMMTEIGAKIMTIHPGLANFLINSIKGYNFNQLIKAVNSLLDAISDLNLTICMENMPSLTKILLDEKEMEQFFSTMNRDDIYFTYDTSHAWTNDANVESLWEKFHSITKNVHIVENFEKTSDTHPALGSGKIDFNEIFRIIKKYNYQGALIIELTAAKDLPVSIEFIKQYL